MPSLYLIILGGACPFLFMFTKPRITAHRLKFGIKWSSSGAARLCPASARMHDLKHKCLSSPQEPTRGHLRKANTPWILGSRGPICPISAHNSWLANIVPGSVRHELGRKFRKIRHDYRNKFAYRNCLWAGKNSMKRKLDWDEWMQWMKWMKGWMDAMKDWMKEWNGWMTEATNDE